VISLVLEVYHSSARPVLNDAKQRGCPLLKVISGGVSVF
jgi:hypothetical protein